MNFNLNEKSKSAREKSDNEIGNEHFGNVPVAQDAAEVSPVKGDMKPPKMFGSRTRPQMSYSCDYCCCHDYH